MKLYNFERLSLILDALKFPEVKESRFEIVRKDLTDEDKRGNVTFKDDGIYLNIKGVEHKGYMYIKKPNISRYGVPSFHITNCSVINEQKQKGWFNGHYFWHNSNTVDLQDRNTGVVYENEKLRLCSRCREQANIDDYFNTQGFFELLDMQNNSFVDKSDLDIFGYVRNWRQISKKIRIEDDFTCNSCKIKIEKKIDHRYIHVHHRNGDKTNNNRENLECLCVLCHSNSDDNHIRNFKNKRSNSEISSFVEKYKDVLNSIKNPYVGKVLKDYK